MSGSSELERITTVDLDEGDLAACLALSDGAGWNQTEADWRLQIGLGAGIGLRSSEGQLIAAGVTLPVTPDTGWIAMVLVDESWRRKGLGRTVMQTLIARANASHLALDATAQGRGLYESLGFRTIERITRYRLDRGGGVVSCSNVRAIGVDGETAFGSGIPLALSRRSDVSVVSSGRAKGLVRPGRLALQVGPLVAEREVDAANLVSSVLSESEGDVYIDVPQRLGSFSRRIERLGFAPDRAFDRMSRGGAYFVEAGTFAIGGPEYS